MATTTKHVKIFFSSPSDVVEEKQWLKEELAMLNAYSGKSGNNPVQFDVFDYKDIGTQIVGTSGQAYISDTVNGTFDVYFGVINQKFGTPTENGKTGTEQEFNDALERFLTEGSPRVLFFFRESQLSFGSEQDIIEYNKVILFRQKISKSGLYCVYRDKETFNKGHRTTFQEIIDAENGSVQHNNIHTHQIFSALQSKFVDAEIIRNDEELQFSSTNIPVAGQVVVNGINHSGFVTYYVPNDFRDDFWAENPAKPYLAAIKRKAVEGKYITRIYIIPTIDLLDDGRFIQLLRNDISSNIDTKVILQQHITNDLAQDFGLWDCCDRDGNPIEKCGIVCFVEIGAHGKAKSCRFSIGAESIREGLSLRKAILSNTSLLDGRTAVLSFDSERRIRIIPTSLQHKAIAKMREIAEESCEGSYLPPGETDAKCKWYHRSWQYLRLLKMVSTPEWHHGFYNAQLQSAIEHHSNPYILISGLADFSMLAYCVRACNHTQSAIHAMDRCITPLDISRWYLKESHQKCALKLFQCDARNTDIRSDHYCIIVSDAFLTRFDSQDRKLVLSEWYRMLKSNGVVITTARKRIDGDETTQATEEEIDEFCKKAKNSLALWKATHLIEDIEMLDESEIVYLAREYAKHMTSHKIGDRTDIYREFNEAGLDIISCNEIETEGEYSPTIYFQIVAQKR